MFKNGLSAAAGLAGRALGGGGGSRVAPEAGDAEAGRAGQDTPVEALDPEQAGPTDDEKVPAAASTNGSSAVGIAGAEPRREDMPGAVRTPDTSFEAPEKAGWVSKATAAAAHVAGAAASVARGAADDAGTAASDVAATAAHVAVTAGSLAAPAAGEAAALAAAGAAVGAAAAGQAASMAAGAAQEAAASAGRWAKEKLAEFRKMMEIWAKQKVYIIASRAMDRVPPALKSALEDEDMPRCVSRGKDRFVDGTWPHVREEVLWELAVYLDGEPPTEKPTEETRGVDCFRAFFRYHLYPFDKTIWRIFRDPVWWVVTLISLVPVHGISPLTFLFRFIIIDKSDEFQLVQFILSFKGMQFITQGVIRSITGYFGFVACVTAPGMEADHRCAESGPGVYGKAGIAGLIGYFFTCFLVWISFALLSCSVGKGRSSLQGVLAEEVERKTIGQKGGLIHYFIWWDVFVVLVFIGVSIWVITTRPIFALDDWAFSQAVFAAQIVHGLLSAPFFFFTLPGLARVLTHALPTAYDQRGRCVPPKLSRGSEQHRREATAQPREALISDEEASELWTRIRSKAGLPKVPGFSD